MSGVVVAAISLGYAIGFLSMAAIDGDWEIVPWLGLVAIAQALVLVWALNS